MNIDLINSYIKEKGLKKITISKKIGVSYGTCLKILQGKQKCVDVRIAKRLSEILEIPLQKIIEDE